MNYAAAACDALLRLHAHISGLCSLQVFQLGLYYGFTVTIFYSCFCRQARMTKHNTRRDIRWVFTMLGVVSIIAIFAPLYGHVPDPIELMLLAAVACVQVATAHHWQMGIPPHFLEAAKS